MYREWKKIEFPKRVLYMSLEIILIGRPRNSIRTNIEKKVYIPVN
jgi:hypothetical protein